jgi:hypothetical protein
VLAGTANGELIADLRANYDTGVVGISNGDTTGDGTGATQLFADSLGTGRWDFYMANGNNPATATLTKMAYDSANVRFDGNTQGDQTPYIGRPPQAPWFGGTKATIGGDELVFHPASPTQGTGPYAAFDFIMVRWTAGAAYTSASIDGAVRIVRNEGGNKGGTFNGTELRVYHNTAQLGSTILAPYENTNSPTFTPIAFSQSVSNIAAGDTVTFVIDPRTEYHVDDTGLVAQISGVVPEPGSFVLGLTALLVLAFCARRRR